MRHSWSLDGETLTCRRCGLQRITFRDTADKMITRYSRDGFQSLRLKAGSCPGSPDQLVLLKGSRA